MRRDYRSVQTGETVGALIVDPDGTPHFDQYAGTALAGLRRIYGDRETARMVMAEGWSNGYGYFAEPTP